MSYESTITVLGAGAGARSWAAHLAQRDWTVLMAARTAGALQEIASVGKVTLDEGERTGDYPVEIVDDPVEAVSRGRWTIICIPADRLPGYRETVIRELGPQQVLLVAPGNTGGALYLGSGFGFEPPFELLELNTLPFV